MPNQDAQRPILSKYSLTIDVLRGGMDRMRNTVGIALQVPHAAGFIKVI